MQEAPASCSEVRDLDPDPDPPDSCPNLSLDLPLPRRPSFALEVFDQFERVNSNSDENTGDVIMSEIASDSQSFVSHVPEHSPSSNLIPRDESNEKSDRKRSGGSLSADTSANKAISTIVNVNCAPASSTGSLLNFSLPNRPVDNYASTYRYCNKNKPPYIIQVQPIQDSDSSSLHPLHISRTLSQIYPRGVLEIRKSGRNKIVAEMSTYEVEID